MTERSGTSAASGRGAYSPTRRDALRAAAGVVAAGALATGTASGRHVRTATQDGDATLTERARLTAPADEAGTFDLFGSAVAVDGDRVLVGAPLRDAGPEDAGAAYLFGRADGGWELAHRFDAGQDARLRARFGQAVSLDGDTALIGAGGDPEVGRDAGAAYVFERTGSGWERTQKLLPDPYDESWDLGPTFGWEVALDDDTALVAAPESSEFDTANGHVVVYRRDGGDWEAVDTLYPEESAATHPFYLVEFGRGLALDSDRALVGAPGDHEAAPDAGAAYVFERARDGFDLDRKLQAPDPSPNERFGQAVDLADDRAAVGGPYAGQQEGPENHGAAYLYTRTGGSWVQEDRITVSESAPGGWLGYAVSIAGDRALVGRPNAMGEDDAVDAGTAHLYQRGDDGWTRIQRLTASDPADGGLFGFATALAEQRAVVADSWHSAIADQAGAAYVFESDTPTSDGGSDGSSDGVGEGTPGFGVGAALLALGIAVARCLRPDPGGGEYPGDSSR